jgi:serine protease Do
MNPKFFKPMVWLIVPLLVVGLACGAGPSPTTAPTQPPAPPPTEPPPPTATQPPPPPTDTPPPPPTETPKTNAITNLQDVKKAIIQIEAQGTFEYPEGTAYNEAGYGSGFIIDKSGLALTNNHVVTGAAILKVWVGGDTSKSYNAKVLGVSECSDLALIDLDGDDFPYLEWHEGSLDVGLEVYAAGFPLGDPEFTLTKGIVSKAKAGGETSWASVDYVIEHDARINPGNSGGPLVDNTGKIVGVNYSGNQADQYFAIGRDIAKSLADQLRNGNVDTIGINGEAFILDTGVSGIWVYSVKSGSPADKAGIAGGDILTTIEGLVLATDGTMSDYCDILRSHSANDTLAIEVYRYKTQEYLSGQLNGRALEVTYSFAGELSGDTGDTGGAYSDYQTVQDDTGTIQLQIPVEWSEIDGRLWEDTWYGVDFTAASVIASADLDSYNNTWGQSGVWFAASKDWSKIGGYVQLLDGVKSWYDDCELDGRYDYIDEVYEGKYDLYVNCGTSNSTAIALSVRPINNPTSFLALVFVQIVTDADLDALDYIMQTFDVIGVLP